MASRTLEQTVSSSICEEVARLTHSAVDVGRTEAATTLKGTGIANESGCVFVVIVEGTVAGVIGEVGEVSVVAGVDAGVVVEEGLVAAESVAVVAVGEVETFETGGVAIETPCFIDGREWVVAELYGGGVEVGGLWTFLIAEMISWIEIVSIGKITNFAIGLG